ncbi:MAG: hypothetical protein JW860_01250 [Sedimentisphaerales bacterium]|nr:hypothetical protein [Sedimentisphaerales bacterium]
MSICDEALKRVYQAIEAYREQNGHNPMELQELVDSELLSPWDLVCPASSFGVGECSYIYRGRGLESAYPGELILVCDKSPWHKGRRNILFANGSIQRPPEKIFQSALEKDNRLRREYDLPLHTD